MGSIVGPQSTQPRHRAPQITLPKAAALTLVDPRQLTLPQGWHFALTSLLPRSVRIAFAMTPKR